MAKTVHIYSIFLASPNDVLEERDKVAEIVDDLNRTIGRKVSVQIELLRWETDSVPGRGSDAQEVINRSISEEFDLFIGIMSHRFGSPNNRYESGTYEEFQRAKDRYYEDKDKIDIMFYFKNEAIKISEIDTEQLEKVKKFKNEIGGAGLYAEFENIEQFARSVRAHLSNRLYRWAEIESKGKVSEVVDLSSDSKDDKEYVDYGLFELEEFFTEKIEEAAGAIERIGTAINELAGQLQIRTDQVNTLVVGGDGAPDRKAARAVIVAAASDMRNYTARTMAEIPLYRDSITDALKHFEGIIDIAMEESVKNEDLEELRNTNLSVKELIGILHSVMDHANEFLTPIEAFPRLTSEMNRAKRETISATRLLISEFSSSIDALININDSLDRAVGVK